LIVILVPVILLVVIGGTGLVIWVVKRNNKKQAGHKFTQLELVDDEEDHKLVEEDE